jgi:menaquinone-dependent protoporphyrinogen IX oxidase
VIGVPARNGQYAGPLSDYVRAHREALAAMPTFLFTVGTRSVLDLGGYLMQFTQRAGWRPTSRATFLDANDARRAEALAFAQQIADEIPVAALQPRMR